MENEDGHFIAAVTALVQSLLEGRTDCPISGVFGAGKTPPERRTIHFIFADPILVAMECVPGSSSSDLKQDVCSCVRSVKIQKLYETFVLAGYHSSHTWLRVAKGIDHHHVPW